MAQSVFRANQVTSKKDKVLLKLTREFAPPVVEVEEEVPEYTGPTADDLRREAEEFKKQWKADKQDLIAKAQEQADAVVKKTEEAAFGIVKKQTDQAQVIKTDAEKQAASIIAEAEEKAQKIISDAKNEAQSVLNKAEADGLAQGRDKGYAEGYEEADRLVKRLHTMVEAVGAKRQEILDSTEQQIVELVLLMTRKVVKILSENQKSVILSNVVRNGEFLLYFQPEYGFFVSTKAPILLALSLIIFTTSSRSKSLEERTECFILIVLLVVLITPKFNDVLTKSSKFSS